MNKKKVKLNSLYGQMVSKAEKPLTASDAYASNKAKKAMKMCADLVRNVKSCKQCLHYAACKDRGASVSRLGRYLAWLNLEALPRIEGRLNPITLRRIRLDARAPIDNGETLEEGYAVVRAYKHRVGHTLICCVHLDGSEDEEAIYVKLFIKIFKSRKGK